jgi:hypothetical protein
MAKIGLLLIILAVIAGTAWLLRTGRRRQRQSRAPPQETVRRGPAGQLEALRRNGNYWGVEIHSGICAASKLLAGRRFPFPEAPSLPLDGCGANQCTCIYLGLWERRKWHRRTQPDRRKTIRYLQDHPDRRCHRERRKIDIWYNRSW